MSKPKIGAVSYLNTVPLIHELSRLAPEYQIELDLPSRLADRLAMGELDVALVPVVEALLSDVYTIVSDACIGCSGPVWSVKLLSRVPVSAIKTVALDEGSRTSAILVKLLLQRKFNLRPQFEKLPHHRNFRTTSADAVLVIGDRAMEDASSDFANQFDLGQCWHEWTGMPFVFAVWAARPNADFDRLSQILNDSRDAGLRQIDLLSHQAAVDYALSPADCRRYFAENLNFRLREVDRNAIREFCDRASALDLLPPACELKYHDCQVA